MAQHRNLCTLEEPSHPWLDDRSSEIIGSRCHRWHTRKLGQYNESITAAPVVARIGVGAAIAAPPVAVGAGVLVTAGIIAGVHTGLLQKTGMIGPGAQKTSDPNWFGGLEMNPSMFTMGTVV